MAGARAALRAPARMKRGSSSGPGGWRRRGFPPTALGSLKPAVKRETLLLAKLPAGADHRDAGPDHRPAPRAGRVRTGYFQAVFDPESALLRVDLALADAPTMDLCDLAVLARLSGQGEARGEKPLNLGCFFDPGEYRFEINAFAVEGEPFLDLYQAANPFGRDDFDLKAPHRVSVRDYRAVARLPLVVLGLVGTIWPRGRLPGKLARKTRPGRMGVSSASAGSPSFAGSVSARRGRTAQTKVIQHSDGPVKYPHAVSRHLDASFYRDLEQCHVAFVFTHGGPIDGVYQVRRGLDVWVVLLPPAAEAGRRQSAAPVPGRMRRVHLPP